MKKIVFYKNRIFAAIGLLFFLGMGIFLSFLVSVLFGEINYFYGNFLWNAFGDLQVIWIVIYSLLLIFLLSLVLINRTYLKRSSRNRTLRTSFIAGTTVFLLSQIIWLSIMIAIWKANFLDQNEFTRLISGSFSYLYLFMLITSVLLTAAFSRWLIIEIKSGKSYIYKDNRWNRS